MRHGKKFNHLGRTSPHRKAMLSNMSISLIEHKRITTTVPKAKALRKFVEPLITKSKTDTTHSRRVVFSRLQDKQAVKELFDGISEKVASRPGGYTRIIKTNNRLGDNANMCIIELVDYNELLLRDYEPKKKSRVRRGKKNRTSSEVDKNQNATIEEAVAEIVETSAEYSIAEPTDTQENLHLSTKERNNMIYKTDPSGLNLNRQEVLDAIQSFYVNKDQKINYTVTFEAEAEQIKAGEKQQFETTIKLDYPEEVDPELLKHFSVRLFSFDMDIENEYVQKINPFNNKPLKYIFNATPTKKGEVKLYLDCFRNASNFFQKEYELSVE